MSPGPPEGNSGMRGVALPADLPSTTGEPAASAHEASAPRRPSGRLFRKYILLFVLLVGGALLASGTLQLWFSYEENKAALARVQREKALSAADRIEGFIDEITRQIGWTARAQWDRSVIEQRRVEYLQLLRQASAVTEISHLDSKGYEELMVSRLAMDVIGDKALLAPGEPTAPAMGMFGTAYMWSLGVLIAGGAANIQRNIIAERGLGMPRDARR